MSVSTADFDIISPFWYGPLRQPDKFRFSVDQGLDHGRSVPRFGASCQSGGTLKGTNRGRVPSVALAMIDHLMVRQLVEVYVTGRPAGLTD